MKECSDSLNTVCLLCGTRLFIPKGVHNKKFCTVKCQQKQYRINNRLKLSQDKRQWVKDNYERHKSTLLRNQKHRLKHDIEFMLARALRKRFTEAFKIMSKSGSAVDDLGCSMEYFKKYLESKFQPGMTWDNYGLKGWHIDHIKPLSKFNLQNEQDRKKACNYKNLQPLWAEDHYIKSNKERG